MVTEEELDLLTGLASPILSAATANVEVERAHSSLEIPEGEEGQTMSNFVEEDAVKRVDLKRLLRDLLKSCRDMRQKVLQIVVEAVDLAVELADDTVVPSPGAVDVADPRIEALTGQLASTRSEVILLTSKVYDFEDVRDGLKLEHDELLKKLRNEAKLSEEHIGVERNGVPFCYHGELRSRREIVKAADERTAGHSDTLTQLQLFFEEWRKKKMILSVSRFSQKRFWVA